VSAAEVNRPADAAPSEGGSGRARVTGTGAEAIVRVLKAAGVEEVFGLASGKLLPLFRALARSEGLRYTGVRHEAAAGFMAASIYAARNRIALCLGETGPGGLNLMSGLGGAAANSLAVLAITSSNTSQIISPDRGAFSSTDNEKIFATIVKWSATIRDAARIPEVLHRALRIALTGRPGPVHVNVPADVLSAQCEYDITEIDAPPASYCTLIAPVPPVCALHDAARLLGQARRPLLVAGGGVVRSAGEQAFRALAERLAAPAITTQMGLGVLPTAHPSFIGQGGLIGGPAAVRAMREADVMLAVGCRFSSFMWIDGPPKWWDAPDRRLIQIDIDPQVLGQNVPLTLGLLGDARQALEGVLDALAGGRESKVDRSWSASLARERREYVEKLLGDAVARRCECLHPAVLLNEVGAYVRPQDFVTFDGGHTSFWSNEFIPTFEPRTRFHEPGMAHLGFGLPAAVALARAFPDRRSFCITGDGAFGFTIQELDTARRYGARVITVIYNNRSWGVIRAGQKASDFDFGTDLSDTDYAAIARAFGCHGERIESAEQIGPALARAADSGLPAVIDALVDFVPHPMLRAFGVSTAAR
jgi:acetolactate synthase-1/2/3 large subunit